MRRFLLLMAFGLAGLGLLGCQNLRNNSGVARSNAEPIPPKLPSALASKPRPKPEPVPPSVTTPGSTAPVVRLNSPIPTAAPPLLEPPVMNARPAETVVQAELDEADRKGILERLKERREERQSNSEKPKPPAELPSPLAPMAKSAVVPPVASTAPMVERAPAATPDAKGILERAQKRYAAVPDYECRFRRYEVLGTEKTPPKTEEVLFQFRKAPFSVYMKNIGEVGRGREVLYVAGQNDDKMIVITGEGDNRLVGAGFRTTLRPDSTMATAKSRHQLTEAGFGNTFARLQKALAAGQVESLGSRSFKNVGGGPHDVLQVTIRPGDDSHLPKGGMQRIFFDPVANSASYALPVRIETTDHTGTTVELYEFDQFRVPANLTERDFHPDRLGKKK
ncbi:MAG: DUF1571 domain-containing protein [Gemmataceae bacterium]